MTTREAIIQKGDELIRDRGYNAFSFYDIARTLGIKNASIHYYFPSKTDLGVEIIRDQQRKLAELIYRVQKKDAFTKLKAFFSIYEENHRDDRVCLVGALATDLHTLEPEIQEEFRKLADNILKWVTEILKEGKEEKIFYFVTTPRAKALMIITNMMAALQLARLTGSKDFIIIKETIIRELKKPI